MVTNTQNLSYATWLAFYVKSDVDTPMHVLLIAYVFLRRQFSMISKIEDIRGKPMSQASENRASQIE